MTGSRHRRPPAHRRPAGSGRRSVLEYAGPVPVACLIAALALAALAGITWIASPSGTGAQAQAQTRNVGVIPSTSAPRTRAVADVVAPDRIVIPRLRADAPIVDVGTTPDGELQVPLDPRTVGWWRYGAKPGAPVGTAILAGHINYAGVTGSMAEIGRLNPGDQIDVYGTRIVDHRRAGGAHVRFTVTGVRTYHKTHLPYQQIFDQHSVGRIVIVTCGGPFDAATGNYRDNIVVFAVPAA